ncbi:MAG: hypothetical protein HQL75_08045 [Magnetococcales bacterium]|nr:hypothetical protein [Magnetococcales bacterium]
MTPTIIPPRPHPETQTLDTANRGSVLVITLILLVVLTIITTSRMGINQVEEKVTANAQKNEMTFQAAESAIETVVQEGNGTLSSTNVLAQSLSAITLRPADGSSLNMNDASVSTRAVVCYSGEGVASGFSMGEDSQSFSWYIYQVRGRGEITTASAITTNLQGIRKLGPSGSVTANCPP